MYYNTTSESKDQVKMFSNKNTKQDTKILEIFQNAERNLSASDVFKRYPIANVPITSIRRSINTLYNLGYLDKTGDKKDGIYGRPENIWRLL